MKDKIIKWLGGFTETEVTEKVKEAEFNAMGRTPCVVYKQLNTKKLQSDIRIRIFDDLPEEYIRELLAKGLQNQIEDCMHVESCVGVDPMFNIYRAQIEVVVREGAE